MPERINMKRFLTRAALMTAAISLLFAAGCAPMASPAPQQAAGQPLVAVSAPTNTPVVPTPTAQEVASAAQTTATAEPTAAATEAPANAPAAPTATEPAAAQAAVPSATPNAAAENSGTPAPDKSFNAWCLPKDASVKSASDPLKPPANAKIATLTTDTLIIRGLPSNGCVFLYVFPQTAAADLQLEVSEANAPSPFFKAKLEPVPGRSDVVYAFVRHSMIIAPPVKTVTFTFALRDPLGQVLRRDQVKLYGYVPAASGGGSGSSDNGDGSGGDGGGEDCGCTVPLP